MCLFTAPAYADSTVIMCPGGRVESGDSKEVVKRKCGKPYSYSNNSFTLNGKNERLKVEKLNFKMAQKEPVNYSV